MKPLLSKTYDTEALQTLGRASVQIIHDLKNQLNGLKLYATFLEKRAELGNRPTDELETLEKLKGGLDRVANDLSTLVRYGQPVEIRKRPGVDLRELLAAMASSTADAAAMPFVVGTPPTENAAALSGEFDPALLSEAFNSITVGAAKLREKSNAGEPIRIQLKPETVGRQRWAIIEWDGLNALDHDPFHSFVGSSEIKMSLAAKIIEAHGGSTDQIQHGLRVRLPLQ